MIFDFIFLSKLTTESSLYLKKEQQEETDLISGYVIETMDDTFFNFFYDPLFFKNGNRFCLALQRQLFEDQPGKTMNFFSEALAPVLFSSSYLTINGHPLIIILNSREDSEQDSSEKKMMNLFTEVFNYLGYDIFYYCFINNTGGRIVETNSPVNLSICAGHVNNEHTIKKWYLDFLEENKVFHSLILLFRPDSSSIDDVHSELENAETEFRNRYPRLFDLLKEDAGLRKQLEQYEINLYGLKKELESSDAYIANLKAPESSLKKLSDFYHYEYEILPAWYKRFGHIIKVIMGKRTFRSLFNDNIKKYKD